MKKRIVCSLLVLLLLSTAAGEGVMAARKSHETRFKHVSFTDLKTGAEYQVTPAFESDRTSWSSPYYLTVPHSVDALRANVTPLTAIGTIMVGIFVERDGATYYADNTPKPGVLDIPLGIGENKIEIHCWPADGKWDAPLYRYLFYITRASAAGDAAPAPAQTPDAAAAPQPPASWPALPKTIIKPYEIEPGTTLTVTESLDMGSMPFVDVSAAHWFRDSVAFVYGYGMMKGFDTTVFAPDQNMTRAMIITALARAAGTDTSAGADWYSTAVEWARTNDIYDGYDPNGNLSRQELALFLWRLAGKPDVAANGEFTDGSDISDPARTAVAWAVSRKICNGYPDGSFKPNNSITRAEVATVLYRYICSEYL